MLVGRSFFALVLVLGVAGCRAPAPTIVDGVPDASVDGAAPAADLASPGTAPVDGAVPPAVGEAADLSSAPADLAPPLPIVEDPIPYGATRQAEMAAYSLEHYGASTAALTPSVIVLHFTAGSTYQGAWDTFAADTANRGELPGTCAQYVVDRDGTVYRLVPDALRCRHAVGLNHVAIGVEMVQPVSGSTLSDAIAADQAILARPAQIGAALTLVKWLQRRYGLGDEQVIGHAMANASPQFLDLDGWVNDHSDWQAADVAEFRARLDALP